MQAMKGLSNSQLNSDKKYKQMTTMTPIAFNDSIKFEWTAATPALQWRQ